MQLDEAIKNRKSVKKFSSRKVDWRDIIECIDSARYAPLAGGYSTLKFIIVSDKEKIFRISEACQQDFVSKVSYVIVVISDSSKTKKSFGERGEIYVRQQAGAAIQNFLLKIEEKGLGSCWVGHLAEKQIKEDLRIPPHLHVEAVFPVGYEFKKEKTSRKIGLDQILYFEKFGNKKMKPVKRVNV